MKSLVYALSIASTLLAGAPATARGADLEKEKAKLMEMQALQRKAHVEENASLLVSMMAEDFISIDSGRISKPAKEQTLKRFQSYFDQVAFKEWDDITPPDIRISDDGTMAYVTVHKKVRLTYKDKDGKTQEETTVFAWLETWRKHNDRWELAVIASTRHS